MSDAPVAQASSIAPGTTKKVVVNGKPVLLCNADGAFYAIEDVCTHDGGELDQGFLQGVQIMCPRHGAIFDVTSGAVIALPAVLPLGTFKVRVEGDDIFVEL